MIRQDDILCRAFYARTQKEEYTGSCRKQITAPVRRYMPEKHPTSPRTKAIEARIHDRYRQEIAEKARIEIENQLISASFDSLYKKAYDSEVQLRNVRAFAARCAGGSRGGGGDSLSHESVRYLVKLVCEILDLLKKGIDDTVAMRVPEILTMVGECPVRDKRLFAACQRLKRMTQDSDAALRHAEKVTLKSIGRGKVGVDLQWLASEMNDQAWLDYSDRWELCPFDLRWLAVSTNDRSWLLNRYIWARCPNDLKWLTTVTKNRDWLLLGASDRWLTTPPEVKLRAVNALDPAIARPSLSEAAQHALGELIAKDVYDEKKTFVRSFGPESDVCCPMTAGDTVIDFTMEKHAGVKAAEPAFGSSLGLKKTYIPPSKSEKQPAGLLGLPNRVSGVETGKLEATGSVLSNAPQRTVAGSKIVVGKKPDAASKAGASGKIPQPTGKEISVPKGATKAKSDDQHVETKLPLRGKSLGTPTPQKGDDASKIGKSSPLTEPKGRTLGPPKKVSAPTEETSKASQGAGSTDDSAAPEVKGIGKALTKPKGPDGKAQEPDALPSKQSKGPNKAPPALKAGVLKASSLGEKANSTATNDESGLKVSPGGGKPAGIAESKTTASAESKTTASAESKSTLLETSKNQPPAAAKTLPPAAAKTQSPAAAKTKPAGAAKTEPAGAAKTEPPAAAKTKPPPAAKILPPSAAKIPPEVTNSPLPVGAKSPLPAKSPISAKAPRPVGGKSSPSDAGGESMTDTLDIKAPPPAAKGAFLGPKILPGKSVPPKIPSEGIPSPLNKSEEPEVKGASTKTLPPKQLSKLPPSLQEPNGVKPKITMKKTPPPPKAK